LRERAFLKRSKVDDAQTKPATLKAGRSRWPARTGWSVIDELRLAASFLTIIPVGPKAVASVETVAASFGYFPLIGVAIGGALAIEDFALGSIFSTAVRSVLIVMSWVLVTGALHLDGVADTADALGAGRNRERALEILRDSHIGVFGAIALFFVLALKCVCLASLNGRSRWMSLLWAPVLGRWAMVAVNQGLSYLREVGAGSALLSGSDNRNLAMASGFSLLALLAPFSSRAVSAAFVAVICALAAKLFYRRWLGGVTGDLLGAVCEIVEIGVLLGMIG
jgi:adenosylcobinamide-GDP ribazoletransferase